MAEEGERADEGPLHSTSEMEREGEKFQRPFAG